VTVDATSLARFARVTLAMVLWWLLLLVALHGDALHGDGRDDGDDRDGSAPAGDVRAAVELFVNETPRRSLRSRRR
jgi:hypothetical protein